MVIGTLTLNMSELHVYKQTTCVGITPSSLSPEYALKKDSESCVHVENGFESSVFSNSASKSNIRSYLSPERTCKNPEYNLKRVWISRTKRGVIPSRAPPHVHVGTISVISSYKVCLSVLSVFIEIGTYNRRAYSYSTLTIYTNHWSWDNICNTDLDRIEKRNGECVRDKHIYHIVWSYLGKSMGL